MNNPLEVETVLSVLVIREGWVVRTGMDDSPQLQRKEYSHEDEGYGKWGTVELMWPRTP